MAERSTALLAEYHRDAFANLESLDETSREGEGSASRRKCNLGAEPVGEKGVVWKVRGAG
jgi:hypothetical protein